MAVALETFEVVYGGDRVRIEKGDLVHEPHPIIRKFPQKFGPQPRSKTTPPRLRAGAPRFLELVPSARAALEAAAAEEDGGEVGGALLGRFVGERCVIAGATVHLENDRGATWFRIDPDRCRADANAWEGSAYEWVGEWHSHRNSAAASDRDLTGWASMRNGPYIGLIVCVRHDKDGWPWLDEIRGWITRPDGGCAPVDVAT